MRSAAILTLLIAALAFAGVGAAQRAQPSAGSVPTYLELVSAGYDLLKEGKARDAYVAALAAYQQDPSRYEAYALAALVLHERGAYADAKVFVTKALSVAPPDRQAKLREFAAGIDRSIVTKTPATGRRGAAAPSAAASRPPAPAAGSTPASVAGPTWSGVLKGTYTYERSASRPLETTFTATFAAGGAGTAAYNALRQSIAWTQKGRYLSIEIRLQDYGCPATLTIRATVDGGSINGMFNMSGDGCAPASGTWTATRAR